MSPAHELPDVAEVLGPLLARVPEELRPLLVAIAERLAAERYRCWAGVSGEPARSEELLACADREEEIARRVEALFPDAAAIERHLLARHPDLPGLNRSIFADRPLDEQYTIQARGERLGAATWRSLARSSPTVEARDTLLSCAELEEQNAVVLESMLAGKR